MSNKAAKCRAKDPTKCVDPNCPEKRGLNSLHGLNAALDNIDKNHNIDKAIEQLFIKEHSARIMEANIFQTETASIVKDPAILATLATDPNYLTRMRVAENIHTSTETLTSLANDKNAWVRETVADNFNTNVRTLRFLSTDEDDSVRSNVARNPNTPQTTLEILTKDPSYWVRREVANNLNTPTSSIYILLNDNSTDVRVAAWNNPNTTDTMRTFAIIVGEKAADRDDWDI